MSKKKKPTWQEIPEALREAIVDEIETSVSIPSALGFDGDDALDAAILFLRAARTPKEPK